MSFPVDIPSTVSGYDSSTQFCRAHDYAFEYSGNQYNFLSQGGQQSGSVGDFHCHANKSTDGGATWTEQDPTHAPALFTSTITAAVGGTGYTVMRDGSTVYVVFVRSTSGTPNTMNGIRVITYDLSTDLWGSSSDISLGSLDFIFRGLGPGEAANGYSFMMFRRDTSDYILYYSGTAFNNGGTKYARVWCANFDGSTITNEQQLSGQSGNLFYILVSGVCFSGGNTQFLYLRGSNLYSLGMDNTNTFSATVQTVIPQSPDGLFYANRPGGVTEIEVYFDGATEKLGFFAFEADSNSTVFFWSGDAALDPTWSSSAAAPNPTFDFPPIEVNVYCVPRTLSWNASNGQMIVVWTWNDTESSGSSGNGFYYYVQADIATLSWTAIAELFAVSVQSPPAPLPFPSVQVSVYPMATGFGVIGNAVNDNDAEISQFYFLAAAGPTVGNFWSVPNALICGHGGNCWT